jgi:hypothetical protein
VFPFLGPEIVEWLLGLSDRSEGGLEQKQPASKSSQQPTEKKITGEQMKNGSVQGRIGRVPEHGRALKKDQTKFATASRGELRLDLESSAAEGEGGSG